jgi:hypothetical protein
MLKLIVKRFPSLRQEYKRSVIRKIGICFFCEGIFCGFGSNDDVKILLFLSGGNYSQGMPEESSVNILETHGILPAVLAQRIFSGRAGKDDYRSFGSAMQMFV